MMSKANIYMAVLLSLCTHALLAQSIERQVIGNTGTTLSNGSTTMSFTIGEIAITSIDDGAVFFSQGFHHGVFSELILFTGALIISEVMQNPNAVDDLDGEYFEIYNPEEKAININGWTISDDNGDTHVISTDVIVDADDFIVLGNNSNTATNGGVTVDYQYSNISLDNADDEIILTDGTALEIDRVAYDGGPIWPNPDGASMIYIGSNIEDNNAGGLWEAATQSEGIAIDYGSPGINGTNQIVDWLVYDNAAWNQVPTPETGLKNALVRASEAVDFNSNINLLSLRVQEDADVSIDAGTTLNIPNTTMESTGTTYSSLISDGAIIGDVTYKRHVNTSQTVGGNDLVTPPVIGQGFADFLSHNDNIISNSDDTLYLFGPFDKPSGSYVTYANTETAILNPGLGYRAATTDNETLSFTGTIHQGVVNQPVFNIGPAYAEWNLIGNPYPSYLNVQDFLTNPTNLGALDAMNVGIYGYDGDASDGWVIYNLNTTDANTVMTPGQGFFVAVDNDASVEFTPNMRRHGNSDDFIPGRNLITNQYIQLQLSNGNRDYKTDFYFNNNSTPGLDPGYDAAMFGQSAGAFAIYSRLVEGDQNFDLAIQSLPLDFLSNGEIPLGVNAAQGQRLTLEMNVSNIEAGVEVYFEDRLENTFTLLNSGPYVLTPMVDLVGTGRFYLHYSKDTLGQNNPSQNALRIYKSSNSQTIVIAGILPASTEAELYDVNARRVQGKKLSTATEHNTMDVSALQSGVYILRLMSSSGFTQTKKILID